MHQKDKDVFDEVARKLSDASKHQISRGNVGEIQERIFDRIQETLKRSNKGTRMM